MGGKTATTTQSVSIPPEVLARYRAVNARAEQVAEQPFQQYGGQFVAPITPTQQAGIGATYQAAGAAQPYYGAAAGLTAAGAGPVTPGELQTERYMSPYTQNVVEATRRGLEQQQGVQLAEQQAAAIRGGAFGGDRANIQRAVLQGQQGLATAQAIAPLYQQAYGQAVQTAQQQQGVGLQAEQANAQRALAAGAQFGQLGSGAQQAGLAGAQALMGAGTLEQQTQQADLTARYQQFLQERGYPFQVAQFLANIAMGTGALSGSTTTTTQPAPFFSDEREKTNIKSLGKGLYAYDYKDDIRRAREEGTPMPPKRVGPMAQDVEKTRPGLVVDVDDYKVIDPSRDSMGGAVSGPGHYAPGGLVGPEDMRSILAMQQQFLGPYGGQGGPYGGQQQGKPGYVPQASLPVPKLMGAGPMPRQQQSALSDLAGGIQQTAGLGESLIGEKGLFGKKGLGSKIMEGARTIGEKTGISSPPPATTPASTTPDSSERSPDEERRAYGGLAPHGYAMGGMPYGGDPTLQNVIEEGKDEIRQLPKPGESPKAPGGLGSDLKDVASLIGAGSSLYSAGSAAASAIPAFLAFLSDEREKTNIKPLGKGLYAYDYKDDVEEAKRMGRPMLPKRVGPMAQDIEEDMPERVRSVDGHKVVGFYDGGLVPRMGYQEGGMPSDDELAVRTMLSEAGRGRRGEINPQEALGIAAVIANRAKARGLSPGDVVLQQGQFEPWSKPGNPNDPMKWNVSSPEYQRMASYWERAKSGEDPTGGASHFWGPGSQFALGRSAPKWSGTGGPRFGGTQFEYVDAKPSGEAAIPTQRAPASDVVSPEGQEVQLQRPAEGRFNLGRPAEGGLGGIGTPRSFEGKPQSFGEFATSKQFLIPLLTGLGAMASSPSRYLGSAVLQGLGAGAQAYSNLEGKEAQIGQTRAQTFETMQRAANLSISGDPVSGVTTVRLANGRTIPITEWLKKYRAGEDVTPMGGREAIPALLSAASKASGEPRQTAEGPVGGSAAPTGTTPMEKPQMPIGVTFGDKSIKDAEDDMTATIGVGREVARQQSADYAKATGNSARAASEAQPLLNEMAINVSKTIAGKGFDTPGVTFAGRAQLANVGNTILRSLGVNDPKYMFSEADTRQALAEKFNAIQSLGLARGAGQESLGALQAVMAAMPQTTMPPEAQAQLAAQLLMLSKKSRDREAHMNEYGRISMNSYQRANQAFETDNPNNNYLSQVTMLKDLILKDPKAVEMMSTGRVSAKQIEDAFKARAERLKQPYVPGLSQYFTR